MTNIISRWRKIICWVRGHKFWPAEPWLAKSREERQRYYCVRCGMTFTGWLVEPGQSLTFIVPIDDKREGKR